jgi:radical SAM superfamily enzyme YgiQ (UPF0313 family)
MILLIGLNIFKGTEPEISYTIGTLAAALKANKIDFEILDLDLTKSPEAKELDYVIEHLNLLDLRKFQWVGLSVFNWNDFLVNDIIGYLKRVNPALKVVLGGPQITYSTNFQLKQFYPAADYFIKGYGEKALVELLLGRTKSRIIYLPPDFEKLRSPYDEVITVKQNQPMLRIETKRGCPYRCAFCAHFDKDMRQKVTELSLTKVFRELEMIRQFNVQKVNVLDPIFNIGRSFRQV